MFVSRIREMCALCAQADLWAHTENRNPVLRFRDFVCGCAPQFRFLRVPHMKRTERKRIVNITIGTLGRTPAHRLQKTLDETAKSDVRPPTPTCAQGHTSTTEVIL